VSLIEKLSQEAVNRGLIDADLKVDAATAFYLVRDMPYRRASDRKPETIIAEWQGTCSGKHYLLQALFKELGLKSQVMACTSTVPIDPEQVPETHQALFLAANKRFVDVHNFLLVEVPGKGSMIVDATWPLSAQEIGMKVNPTFILGENQRLAAEPIETWSIPEGQDPQEYKQKLLEANFTSAELAFRQEVIDSLSQRSNG
jgi:hypothetical protein